MVFVGICPATYLLQEIQKIRRTGLSSLFGLVWLRPVLHRRIAHGQPTDPILRSARLPAGGSCHGFGRRCPADCIPKSHEPFRMWFRQGHGDECPQGIGAGGIGGNGGGFRGDSCGWGICGVGICGRRSRRRCFDTDRILTGTAGRNRTGQPGG